jgi:outer membrane protein, multidrug efflux system
LLLLAPLLIPLLLAQATDPLLAPLPAEAETVTSFDEALARLRQGSDTLEIAAARARAAAAQSRQALAALLPLIQGTASATYDVLRPDSAPTSPGAFPSGAVPTGGGNGTPTSPLGVGQLSARVPLIDVSLWQGRAAARAGEAAAAADRDDVERTLVLALASTLIDVLSAERAAVLSQVGLTNALEREHLVSRTLELGTGTRLDLVRAQQDRRLARSDVLAGRERALQARESLGVLLGRNRPVGVAGGLDLDRFFQASRRLCQVVATASRADVQAARLRHQANQELAEAARADYLPSLALQSAATAITVTPGPLRVPSWTVAAVLDIPLWDGGGRGARLDERRWIARAAEREAFQVARTAEVDRARALRGVRVATDLLAEAQASRDLAVDADRMTRRSFEAGAATSLEMVQSAQLLRQAELVLAARQFELHTARFAALVSEASCDILCWDGGPKHPCDQRASPSAPPPCWRRAGWWGGAEQVPPARRRRAPSRWRC